MPNSLISPLLNSLKQSLIKLPYDRIVIGFSGGLDSSALLHAIATLKKVDEAFKNTPVLAIHVHHGLSESADQWLEHCERFCLNMNVECIGERVLINKESGSLENAARNARYDVFEKHCSTGDVLLLAHHQDDQIETFMMRLMRGSGLTGLSSMQAVRPFAQATILRPWLHVSRKRLESYVTEHNIEHIEDESNLNTKFDRNWWRQVLLPKLSLRYPQSNVSIIKTINTLQQERQLLEDLLTPIYQSVLDTTERYSNYATLKCDVVSEQSTRVQIQLIRMWLQQQAVYPGLNAEQIESLIKEVVAAKVDANPVYQWQQHQVRRYSGKLYLLPNFNEAAVDFTTKKPQAVDIQGGCSIQLTDRFYGNLRCDKSVDNGLEPDVYELTVYDASLKAKPVNRPNKTLKKWFQEYSVPSWLRSGWPVLLKNGHVACVPGLFVCEGHHSQEGLECRYESSFISFQSSKK